MSVFRRALREAMGEGSGARRWVYVPYDQLTHAIGPLSRLRPSEAGIVLIENPEKGARRPYHKQKLALVLTSQRHFALEQAKRGVAVRYEVGPYGDTLRRLSGELGPLTMMRPAERELREELAPLVQDGALVEEPHEGWLTTPEDFSASCGDPPWRMDTFYRHVRTRTGILMDDDGQPAGGRLSFDADNRKAWPGEPAPPEVPRFRPDDITREVAALVEDRFGGHPGILDVGALPASQAQVRRLWDWARTSCLPGFGPYEDAMASGERTLWHTRISGVLNLHRITPREVLDDVLALELPLASKEGFIRQLLGWREFVHHVHEATDGLRSVPSNVLGASRDLPAAWWGTPSGLRCLDEVVRAVWEEGYSHHITRLMVLSNLALLLDVDPRQLTDWFWVAYTDAYDWVVEPNVLGMGAFATGTLMITKPYVSGAAYIHRMSDYCAGCAFHPKKDCPITPMYWAFLQRHRASLEGNPRMAMPLASCARRSDAQRQRDAAVFERVGELLTAGGLVRPDDVAP